MNRFGYENDLHNGKYAEAELALSRILEKIDPSLIPARDLALLYNDRGQARYQQVKFYEAVEDYDLGIRLYSREGSMHYNRSTILYRMGDYTEALSGFKKAVELAPENAEFKAGLESCLDFLGKLFKVKAEI